jgi:hypothetical protein
MRFFLRTVTFWSELETTLDLMYLNGNLLEIWRKLFGFPLKENIDDLQTRRMENFAGEKARKAQKMQKKSAAPRRAGVWKMNRDETS